MLPKTKVEGLKRNKKSISEETNEKKTKTDKRIMLWMSVLICKVKIKSIL